MDENLYKTLNEMDIDGLTKVAKQLGMPLYAHDKASDSVNHPSHYTMGKVECIDALEAATINLKGIEAVCTANAIKYLWRWKEKNGAEDLAKASWYIARLTKTLTQKEEQKNE